MEILNHFGQLYKLNNDNSQLHYIYVLSNLSAISFSITTFMNTTFLYCKYTILNLSNSYILSSNTSVLLTITYYLAITISLLSAYLLNSHPGESSTNSHRPGVGKESKRVAVWRLCDDVYQRLLDGRGFGHCRWSGFIPFFLKDQAKRFKKIPLKMPPTWIWYFTQGFKTKRSLRSDVDRSTDR